MLVEPGYRLAVDLDDMKIQFRLLYQVFGKHAHSRANLDEVGGTAGETLDNTLSNALVGEEMLA